MSSVTCAACGAVNGGTKFCESCGALAAVVLAAAIYPRRKPRQDELYLAKLEAQAEHFRRSPNANRVGSSQTELDEIRKWEGPAAAREALTARLESPLTPRPSIVDRKPSVGAPTNVMAILALVFGIGGGLLGIIFGHIALNQIERTGEQGRGLAVTGLVFGYLGLALGVIVGFGIVATVPRY